METPVLVFLEYLDQESELQRHCCKNPGIQRKNGGGGKQIDICNLANLYKIGIPPPPRKKELGGWNTFYKVDIFVHVLI